jgi:hypothetical protein
MNQRLKTLLLILVSLVIVLLFGLFTLPRVARALPGEMRVRLAQVPLGETLLELGVTPMPTALPVPANAVAQSRLSIPTIVPATAEPKVTSEPAAVPVELEPNQSAVPTDIPTSTPTPTVSPTTIPPPQQARIGGVGIIPQGFNNCGPANLTINLNFYGDSTTQSEAAAFLKPNREDRNVSPWQMVDYVNNETDLRAFFGSGGDMDLLKRLIAAGFPVVIEKGYELPTEGWLGHYLTVFGYDDSTGQIVSMDTNLGPWDGSGRYDSYEEIEKYWGQFNYNFFVVYPPEQEQYVFDILGPEMLDDAAIWQNAAEIAQAAIDRDEEDAFAWFNLGTSLTRLGEMTGETAYYENGAAAFDQAFILGLPPRILWYQYRPYIAYMKMGRYQEMIDLAETIFSTQGGRNVEETHLYLGHARAFLGDGPGAVEAYQEALRLNENFYPAQWALDSIVGGN